MTLRNTLCRVLFAAGLSGSSAVACAWSPTPENTMAHPQTFDPPSQRQAATSVLRSYQDALNRGDVDAIVLLYAPDAVFMAQHRTPAIGAQAIAAAYREIFGVIRLDVVFEIDEVVVVSPTVAYARTRSAGTTTILDNDVQLAESNQELFVLLRDDEGSDWKIGRYIFSTTQPPRSRA